MNAYSHPFIITEQILLSITILNIFFFVFLLSDDESQYSKRNNQFQDKIWKDEPSDYRKKTKVN